MKKIKTYMAFAYKRPQVGECLECTRFVNRKSFIDTETVSTSLVLDVLEVNGLEQIYLVRTLNNAYIVQVK